MKNYLALLLCACFFLFSCTKNIETDNIESPDYNPEFALPLITLNVGVEEVLQDATPGSYTIEQNGLVIYDEDNLNIARTDTFEVDLSDVGESIQTMEYKLVIENGVPVGGEMQLYFLDENGNTTTTLLDETEQIILPAEIDNSGNVINTTYQEVIIPFDNDAVQNLLNTKQMLIETYFQTSNGGNVFTSQNLSIRLGAKVIFDI